MKKTNGAAVLALLLMLVASGRAQSSVWKVQKDGSNLYIGGTIHLLRASDYPLPPEFEKAYQASSVLVFETDMAGTQDPAFGQKLLAGAVYPEGITLRDKLKPETLQRLSQAMESAGIPMEPLLRMRPVLHVLTLTIIEYMKMGLSPDRGVDLHFHTRAIKDAKTVHSLESLEEQLRFLLSMGEGKEDDLVLQSLDDLHKAPALIESMVAAWRKGDADALWKDLIAEMKKLHPEIYKQIIADRNRNWLPLLEAHLKTPDVEFVLVGAGHLSGPDGILTALKLSGCEVVQLRE
ncbi:MAG: TraB/GumN family protein [Kiritimatiellia bacterium]|nr:TraB/GumN family protein [Kiritimatiellia bacterium]